MADAGMSHARSQPWAGALGCVRVGDAWKDGLRGSTAGCSQT